MEASKDDLERGGFEFSSTPNRLKNEEEMSSARLLLRVELGCGFYPILRR